MIYFTGSALYYSFFVLTNYKLPPYFKCLFLFVSLLFLYGFALILLGDDIYWQAAAKTVKKYLYILWFSSSLLSVIPVYVFTCRGWLDEKKMKIIFFIFFVSCIYAFYGSLKFQILQAAMMNNKREAFTVTCVYSFLSILPLVVLFKKQQILQFLLLAIMFAYCVLGAKRGPVIFGGISSILLIFSMFIHSSFSKKAVILVVSLISFIGIYFFINHQIEANPYLAVRVQETLDGNTSGRETYVQTVYDYYVNSTNVKQFFFGIGAEGTLSVNESYAHNDWLGILLEQGLLGEILYLLLWLSLVYTWLLTKMNSEAFVVIGLLVFIGLGKTVFSMYYLPVSAEMMTSSGFFAIALGYYLGKAFPQHDLYVIQVPLKGNV